MYNITFKGKNYSIDKSLLSSAIASLEATLSGMSSGGSDIPSIITWDGNTEGLVCVDNMFYKVSDLVLTHDEIKASSYMCSNGATVNVNDEWDFMNKIGVITEDCVNVPNQNGMVMFVMADNVSLGGMPIPERGIYFSNMGGTYVSSLTLPTA